MNNTIWTPDQPIRALSWKQPYGELMLHGKQETRSWPTKYRGWVLLCASKQPYYTDQLERISGITQILRMGDVLDPEPLNIEGYAFAIGRLVDCQPMRQEDEDICFVRFQEGLWRHIYEDVQRIAIFPWKGSQGWREVPQDIKSIIKIIK